MIRVRSTSPQHTARLAAAVAGLVAAGDVVVLAGEMGAGKTAFAQGVGRAMGVHEPITSPTFALLHSYAGRDLALYHADVYRLETRNELADLGLGELDDGVVVVEWGDVVAPVLGDHLAVTLLADPADDGARQVTIEAVGRAWATRWDALEQAVNLA